MANEQQYFNPIIQAMMGTAQLQQGAAQQGIEKERNKAEAEARKQQLAQSLKQIEYEHEHQTGMLDLQGKQHQLAAEVAKLQATLELNKAAAGGLKIGPTLNSLQSGQTPGGPNLTQGLTAADFTNPAEEAQRVQNLAQAQSTGTSQGALPAEQTLAAGAHANKMSEIGEQHKNDLLKLIQSGANEERVAKIHGDYSNSNAAINGSFHLKGIALMHQLGMDDGSGQTSNIAKQITDGLFNGTMDYSKLTQDQKRAVTAYASANGEESSIPTDNKTYVKKLDTVSGLQTLVNQFRDLAANYSRDSSGSFSKGNQAINVPLVGTLQRTQPGSDMDSKINTMKAMGGQLASYFDQQNRKSDAEIIRQVTGLFDPKSTKEQNLKKVEDHVVQLQQAVKNVFVGMQPDRVNKILGDRGIGDFGAFGEKGGDKSYKNIYADPKTGHAIGSNDGQNWFDVKTGKEIK